MLGMEGHEARLVRLRQQLLTLFALLPVLCSTSHAATCRQGPLASAEFCALPVGLGNFQGLYHCANTVTLGRPQDKAELLQMIKEYDLVKGVGVGHSWWMQQFCAGDNSSAVGITTTEMATTRAQMMQPNYSKEVPSSFPIRVDEAGQRVTVQAGITQRALLDYLAAYNTTRAPHGYSLNMFAWYIDQTVGGAVATGTHGSSMRWGSLSSQVTRLELAVANGTLVQLTPENNLHLWRAGQISVGRLGIITELDFIITPQALITRTQQQLSWAQFVAWIGFTQDAYRAALASGSQAAISAALAPLDMAQLFWVVGDAQLLLYTYNRTDIPREFVDQGGNAAPPRPPPPAVAEFSVAGRRLTADAPLPPDVYAQAPMPTVPPSYIAQSNPLLWSDTYLALISAYFPNGTFTEREAVLSENELMNRQNSASDPYDQYELSVSLESAGDCLHKVGEYLYGGGGPGAAFPVEPLIRFVNGEGALLANANGGPRMFFNIEDHTSWSTGQVDVKFQGVVEVFRRQCGARMHWGKAGWPAHAACFDGAAEYPDTWCDFGCAVQELDPLGKFRSLSDVWTWNATSMTSGAVLPLAHCCSHAGFDKSLCTCAHRAPCA